MMKYMVVAPFGEYIFDTEHQARMFVGKSNDYDIHRIEVVIKEKVN